MGLLKFKYLVCLFISLFYHYCRREIAHCIRSLSLSYSFTIVRMETAVSSGARFNGRVTAVGLYSVFAPKATN